MRVGIIGAGPVGESFGKALLNAKHEVMFSSRDPSGEHAKTIRAETGALVELPEDVLSYSAVIAIAMPPDTVLQFVQQNAGQLANKVIIDMNNYFGPADPGKSFAEKLADITKGRVVKCFNTIGAEHYQRPVISGQQASMFIAGNDLEARQLVGQLAADLGFDVIDVGSLDNAGMLEQLARLWVHLMRNGYGRNIAFKLLKG